MKSVSSHKNEYSIVNLQFPVLLLWKHEERFVTEERIMLVCVVASLGHFHYTVNIMEMLGYQDHPNLLNLLPKRYLENLECKLDKCLDKDLLLHTADVFYSYEHEMNYIL